MKQKARSVTACVAVLLGATSCASAPRDDRDDSDSASHLTATSAEITAAGFTKKTSFTQVCPKTHPRPFGCDSFTTSVKVTRFEHADGRILFLVGDQIIGSFQRGSSLHTTLASANGKARHGRHVLVTLVDYAWSASDGPAAIVDVDVDRDEVGALPKTFAGVPLEVRGAIVHGTGVRLAWSGYAHATTTPLGMTMFFGSGPGATGGASRYPALTPQLEQVRVGDTFFQEEVLREPYGDVPTVRPISTPTAAHMWATVAAPEVALGALELHVFNALYTPRCTGHVPASLGAPSAVSCNASDPGCSSDGHRFAVHVSAQGLEADVAYTGEAKSLPRSVIMDGGRIFAGHDANGGDVSLILEPGGGIWQLKFGGATYGFPDNVDYDYGTVGCRSSR